jgi:plasmid stability protein
MTRASSSSSKDRDAWLLERLAQGELDPEAAAALRARLAAEGRSVDEELAALARSNQEILGEQPKAVVAAAIRAGAAAGAAPPAARRWPWQVPALALAGALGVAVLVVGGVDRGSQEPTTAAQGEEENIGIKSGDPRLLVYRQRGDRHERLPAGARAARGDLLQLAYAGMAQGQHGVLLSLDGAGRVTRHLPAEGVTAAVALSPGREIRLPTAYELDDAPAFERFVMVTAPHPFAADVAVQAARAVAARKEGARTQPLPLPAEFSQTSIAVEKEKKP